MRIPQAERNLRIWRSPWFWIPFSLLVLLAIYTIISYWIPYFQWRSLKDTIYPKCAAGDKACVDKTLSLWRKSLEIQAPLFRVLKTEELAQALEHPDGTACFLITDTSREASKDEMKGWLDAFGAKRFYEMMPFFMRLRRSFEEGYHPPNPLKARAEAAARLKWHHFPLGRTWRDYNLAGRFWEWGLKAKPAEPEVSASQRQEIFSQYVENGYLFQDQNILSLFDMAKAEIEGDQGTTR